MKLEQQIRKIIGLVREKQPEILVVGPPRSGFTLLISIINNLLARKKYKINVLRYELRSFMPDASDRVSNAIKQYFSTKAGPEDLIYSPEFQFFLGGPKWLSKANDNEARVRKYIGLRGRGDLLLILNFPKFVLNHDNVTHSHYSPGKWADDIYYNDYLKLSSVRNPIDIINSSVFSLNALTGEYIDRYTDENPDSIRDNLAKYKLTDLNFIEGLIQPLITYFTDFLAVRDKYYVMKWEDLITHPEHTISRISKFINLPIETDVAISLWSEMNLKNQTAHHRHNFRKGIIGDWKNHLLNEHLEVLKSHGFDIYLKELGYDKIEYFKKDAYTDFQKEIEKFLKQKRVYRYFEDQDLFTFAFNKSNFQSAKYEFSQIKGDNGVEVERSTINDMPLLEGLVQTVEVALESTNQIFRDIGKRNTDEIKS
jgi:hypothetical protein